jgi:hypothetical protein
MLKLARLCRFVASVSIVCASSASFASSLATSAQVYLASDPGSWVGGGLGAPSVLWTHGIDGVFSANAGTNNGVTITYQGSDYWNFNFYAPLYDPATNTLNGQDLRAGVYYDMATRYPFNSPTRPGLSVYGAGRGDNQSSGWFYVFDFARAANGELARLAIDFKQFDENLTETGPGLYGALRYNSTIPIYAPIPEPSTGLLVLGGLLGLAGWRRARN